MALFFRSLLKRPSFRRLEIAMILTRRLLLTFAIWVGALFVVFFLLPASQANAGPIEVDCPGGTMVGSTYTLPGDCVTDETLTVGGAITGVDGGGFTITGQQGMVPFEGPVLTNATGVTTMNVTNLTIQGVFTSCSTVPSPVPGVVEPLTGIQFLNASGTIDNVFVLDITANLGCQQGHGYPDQESRRESDRHHHQHHGDRVSEDRASGGSARNPQRRRGTCLYSSDHPCVQQHLWSR